MLKRNKTKRENETKKELAKWFKKEETCDGNEKRRGKKNQTAHVAK